MRHLFSAWPELAARIRGAKQVLLLSDYDGTLAPIVEHPEAADMPHGARTLLQKLAQRRNFTVGIISGRALADLKGRVGLDGVTYAGNHGLEIEGPGIAFIDPVAEEIKPFLHLLHQVLSRALTSVKGAFVENKGLSLTVHYRQAEAERAEEVIGTVESIVNTSRAVGKVKTTTGKKVFEVRPAVDWDKGRAIELLIRRHSPRGGKNLLPIFMGDDLTDEDGFRAVEKYGGISIHIGEDVARSCASYFMRSPSEVESFLKLLAEPKQRLGNGLA